ncbi:MAG TPA: hypothetical protein DCZ30_03450 [Clostridiales bacterium]|nr:hypothetical protein [Clostridiales bacterium]
MNLTVYLDIIFLENFFMNYILLFAVSYIMKVKSKQLLIITSSILRQYICSSRLFAKRKALF